MTSERCPGTTYVTPASLCDGRRCVISPYLHSGCPHSQCNSVMSPLSRQCSLQYLPNSPFSGTWHVQTGCAHLLVLAIQPPGSHVQRAFHGGIERLDHMGQGPQDVGMDLLEFVRGCTFDDFLLTPQRGVLPRRDPAAIDLTSRFSEHISASPPARLGEHGHGHARGDGVRARRRRRHRLHRSWIPIRRHRAASHGGRGRQAHAARRHRRSARHRAPTRTIAEAVRMMEQTGVGTLAVVDDRAPAARSAHASATCGSSAATATVAERMTPSRPPRRPRPGPSRSRTPSALMADAQDQEAAARQPRTHAARPDHVERSRHAPSAAVRDPGRSGPAAGRRGDRRNRRLSRAGGRSDPRGRRSSIVIDIAHGHSRRDGARDRADAEDVRRRSSSSRATSPRRKARRFCSSAASTPSRSASVPAAAARRE